MALCSLSSKLSMDSYTVVDNTFLNEFLPQASGDDVKVYMYGLSLCLDPNVEDNALDVVSKVLGLSEEEVTKSFAYWQEMGLVQIVSTNPFEVKYLPVRAHSGSMKIRNKEKYSDFNKQMQEIITGRMITPNEFNEYYTLIEVYHIEPEALILIAKYCTIERGTSISYPYITAVAKDFASQGFKTAVTVEERFFEQEKATKDIKQILNALGLRRNADIEERNLYLKWKNQYEFSQNVIVSVAKSLGKGGFTALDNLLSKYYEQKLYSVEEIEQYSTRREEYFDIAKNVSRNMGLSYQNYEPVVDTYVTDWANKGFERDTLLTLSSYAFRQNIRSLEGLNTVIQKFYKLGLISTDAINQYMSKVVEDDECIKEILDKVGLVRNVNGYDRDVFKTWTENWNFPKESLLIVAENCKGMTNPISYMNKVLSNLHLNGVEQPDDVTKQIKNLAQKPNPKKAKFETREYTKEEFSAVFDSLDDVEL